MLIRGWTADLLPVFLLLVLLAEVLLLSLSGCKPAPDCPVGTGAVWHDDIQEWRCER